jgi:hypothetical protein
LRSIAGRKRGAMDEQFDVGRLNVASPTIVQDRQHASSSARCASKPVGRRLAGSIATSVNVPPISTPSRLRIAMSQEESRG